MKKELENLSPSKTVAARTIYEALKILKEEGGQLPGREVFDKIRKRIEFTDWEKERYEKTGYVRWESIMHFYTVDCIKAGFLKKNKGIWYLTEEGEKALKLGPVKLLETASAKYRKWDAERKKDIENIGNEEITVGEDLTAEEDINKVKLSQLEEQATEGLKEHLTTKTPYEFQDMVAALLRAMGYYTPFIAQKGPDGGIDVIAYQDPLGTKTPRIKVQVKHQPDSAISIDKIKSLIGSLNKDSDVGLFVTSGRFTSDSQRFALNSSVHVKLIDFGDFISLWQQFYLKLTDEEKNMLPLHPIYFLGSNE
ncbi:MAG: Mrr restriction system protein [Ignavibacteriaceae bacterium]